MANGAYAAGWTGRLTADPDVRIVAATGDPWVRLRVAVSNSTKNQKTGEWVENTTFWSLKAFRKLAMNITESMGLVKGSEVTFSGQIQSETWTAADGTEKTDQAIIMLDHFAVELANGQVPTIIRVSGKGAAPAVAQEVPRRAPAATPSYDESADAAHFGAPASPAAAGSPWDAPIF